MQTLSQRWLKICNTVWPNISHLQLDWSKSVELCRDLLRGLKFLVLFILDVNFLLAFYFRLVKFVSEVQVKHSKMNANAIQYVLFFIMILKLCELEWSCTSEYIYRLNFSILLLILEFVWKWNVISENSDFSKILLSSDWMPNLEI